MPSFRRLKKVTALIVLIDYSVAPKLAQPRPNSPFIHPKNRRNLLRTEPIIGKQTKTLAQPCTSKTRQNSPFRITGDQNVYGVPVNDNFPNQLLRRLGHGRITHQLHHQINWTKQFREISVDGFPNSVPVALEHHLDIAVSYPNRDRLLALQFADKTCML